MSRKTKITQNLGQHDFNAKYPVRLCLWVPHLCAASSLWSTEMERKKVKDKMERKRLNQATGKSVCTLNKNAIAYFLYKRSFFYSLLKISSLCLFILGVHDVCMCVNMYVPQCTCRGQGTSFGVGSLLPHWRCQELNSGPQVWQQAPLPSEPPRQPLHKWSLQENVRHPNKRVLPVSLYSPIFGKLRY